MENNVITYDDFENLGVEKTYNKLEKKVQEIIEEQLLAEKERLVEVATDCESPIERILSVEMKAQRLDTLRNRNYEVIEIEKQEEILIGKHKYRADFVIPVYSEKLNNGITFIVECDGHEFHERSKEQVKRDNERERNLTSAGYVVIKFSGSEIYNDPEKCVDEIKEIIFSRMYKLK